MALTLGFDIYGTLFDTHGVVEALRADVGEQAPAFSRLWREKQLEYTFRRGLMRHYVPFAECVADALDYCDAAFAAGLAAGRRSELLGVFATLPTFPDAVACLDAVRAGGHRVFAFSNGAASAVEGLLANAAIRDRFDGVVSVEEQRSFKPDPGVYAHFLRATGSVGGEAWLVSGNPFDVIGAVSAGMRAAWVHREGGPPWDPWGIEPTVTIGSLSELAGALG